MVKHLHFGLICPKDIVLEVLVFVEMQLCKPKPCSHVFLARRGFLLETLTNIPYLCHLFLIVLSWTLIFNMLIEACRVWGGFHTGSLVQNGARFALKIANMKAVMRTQVRTEVPNPRLPEGGGLSSVALELAWIWKQRGLGCALVQEPVRAFSPIVT